MSSPLVAFLGSVPANYDAFLGPLLFEPYALDLTARLQNKSSERILELACGTGRVTRHLAALTAGNGTLTATDLNADMLTVAKEKVSGGNVQWQTADAQALPFQDNSFTVVVCQFGVMFFPDKALAFREVYRVLQQGGMFLFNTWDAISHNPANVIIQQVLQDVLKEDAPSFLEKGPFSFFDEAMINQLLTDAGFQKVHIETVVKTGKTERVANVVDGFIKGSPLAAYLQEKTPEVKQQIAARLTEQLTTRYGKTNLQIPMQALVCSAVK